MSAQIYLHPRSNEGLFAMCRRFNQLGYWLSSTRRGYIEAKRIPLLTNVVDLPRKPKK